VLGGEGKPNRFAGSPVHHRGLAGQVRRGQHRRLENDAGFGLWMTAVPASQKGAPFASLRLFAPIKALS